MIGGYSAQIILADLTHEQHSSIPTKYFSRAHEARARLLTEQVLLNKITPAQFRAIYAELTGDQSKLPSVQRKFMHVTRQ